jgi:hypothetical protein
VEAAEKYLFGLGWLPDSLKVEDIGWAVRCCNAFVESTLVRRVHEISRKLSPLAEIDHEFML